jgi:CRISPR-associated protein Cas2
VYVVVSYDVVNDKTRTKLAKLLFNYGRRVQKSVFECVLDEKRLLEMQAKINKAIDAEVDSVRYYSLCQRCVAGIDIVGLGTVTEDLANSVIIV